MTASRPLFVQGWCAEGRIAVYVGGRILFARGVKIARVTLEIALRKDFDYRIPEELELVVQIGSRVKVPFGSREVLGCVTDIVEQAGVSDDRLKSLIKVIGQQALITKNVLRLARWIAEYYCCPIEIALKSALPEAVRKEAEGWRERLVVRASAERSDLSVAKLTVRQKDLVELLRQGGAMPMVHAVERLKTTAVTLRKLEDLGFLEIRPEVDERDPYANETILPTTPLALNEEQRGALGRVIGAMDAVVGDRAKEGSGARVFLLHGVTGSGKTEVYLQAIEHALSRGLGAIVLVPEISLTPQTVERFKARFCGGAHQTLVAVLHSHLSSGERHDEWHKIRDGRARIVIGARSAVFAPVEPLGLVIVDEEHEFSYKQEESPRYHARDVAVVRGQMEGAVVVLGTATPSMETFYNTKQGKYALLEMKTRADDKKMPLVRVVDMRSSGRGEKGPPIFSPQLKEAITQRLEKKEQVMLFLNRRGYATSMQCLKCGYVAQCEHCSVSLTYHRKDGILLCHVCGAVRPAPKVCPAAVCRDPGIRFSGIGTEKVEEVLGLLFPRAVVSRMDSDALKRKDDYRRILGDFKRGKIDILLGTQMIAKGLHFPNVTLVGIVNADLGLHIPDFRAGERTFQLLTQVAGRAGRGDVEGEVWVQSFTPFHPAIQYARRHDYEGFYDEETSMRAQLSYPPMARVALITFRGVSEEKVMFASETVKKELERRVSVLPGVILAGPAPAPLIRAEGDFRFQIMLRVKQMTKLSRLLNQMQCEIKLPEGVAMTVDIDPVNLF